MSSITGIAVGPAVVAFKIFQALGQELETLDAKAGTSLVSRTWQQSRKNEPCNPAPSCRVKLRNLYPQSMTHR